MFKKAAALLLSAAAMLLSGGCARFTELADRAIVKAVGVDIDNESGIYRMSIQYFSPTKEGGINQIDKTQSNVLLSVGEGKSLFEAAQNASFKTGKDMLFGQNRIILIGKDVCGTSLYETLRFFVSSGRCHPKAVPIIADGKAEDFTAIKFKEGDVSSGKLVTMLDNARADGRIYSKSIYGVMSELKSSTESALLPLMKITEEKTDVTVTDGGESSDKSGGDKEKTIALSGCAVFFKDTLAAFADIPTSAAAALLSGQAKSCPVSFDAPSGRTTLSLFKILSDIRAEYEDDKLTFYITVNTAARYEQYAGDGTNDPDEAAKTAKAAGNVISEVIRKGINDTAVSFGADVFGFEKVLRHYRSYIWRQKRNEMSELLKNAEYAVDVTVRPYSTGLRVA